MSEMNNIYLVEPEDFDQNPRYEIKKGESLDRRISVYCVIQPVNIQGIKTHSLITAHHPLGGGCGGWDSYEENLAIINGPNPSNEQLLDCAHKYAKQLSSRNGYAFFDLDKVKKIQETQRKLRDTESDLETLTA